MSRGRFQLAAVRALVRYLCAVSESVRRARQFAAGLRDLVSEEQPCSQPSSGRVMALCILSGRRIAGAIARPRPFCRAGIRRERGQLERFVKAAQRALPLRPLLFVPVLRPAVPGIPGAPSARPARGAVVRQAQGLQEGEGPASSIGHGRGGPARPKDARHRHLQPVSKRRRSASRAAATTTRLRAGPP